MCSDLENPDLTIRGFVRRDGPRKGRISLQPRPCAEGRLKATATKSRSTETPRATLSAPAAECRIGRISVRSDNREVGGG